MRDFDGVALAAILVMGCGAGGNGSLDGSGEGTGPSGTGAGGEGSGVIFGSLGGGTGFGSGGGSGRTRSFNGDCVAEVSQGEQVPLDIYIMFDTSCSMGCSPDKIGPGQCCNDPNARIHGVRAAVEEFLRAPTNVGISVGIGYFGFMPFEQTSCDPAVYVPEVPIAPLPGQAQPIIDSLNAHIPIGETPTGAAIRAACQYTRSWWQQNPSHVVVNLLVTDGIPEAPLTTTCNPTIQDAAAAAAECAGQVPQVPTYVLGVGGALQELNNIAASGGTRTAYLVEGTNVQGEVFAALNQIRGIAAIPCEFKVPPPPAGEALDFGAVNVDYTNSGQSSLIYYVGDAASCDPQAGGWYYDNAQSPDRILLCPSTCSVVENTTGGQVDIAVGCDTQVITR